MQQMARGRTCRAPGAPLLRLNVSIWRPYDPLQAYAAAATDIGDPFVVELSTCDDGSNGLTDGADCVSAPNPPTVTCPAGRRVVTVGSIYACAYCEAGAPAQATLLGCCSHCFCCRRRHPHRRRALPPRLPHCLLAQPGLVAPHNRAVQALGKGRCFPVLLPSPALTCTTCADHDARLPSLPRRAAPRAGSYCTAGVMAPTKCGAGTFNDLIGQAAVGSCQSCLRGYYSAAPGGTLWYAVVRDETQCTFCRLRLLSAPHAGGDAR